MQLTEFLMHWLEHRETNQIEGATVNIDGDVTETLLYSDGQFQVEMLSVTPNTILTTHSHPDVDSYEVYVSGDLTFEVDDKSYVPTESYSDYVRVPDGCTHGGKTGERGGVFLSVQLWKNGVKPTFISENWNGETCRNHKKPLIKLASSNYIHSNLGRIFQLLNPPILMSDGEETFENVYSNLIAGTTKLALVKEDGFTTLAFTLDIVEYGSGKRELSIPIMGGSGLDNLSDDFMPFVIDIAKKAKCSSIVGFAARKGWSRKLKDYGWKSVREIIKYEVES